jgi:hypothetical protein
MNPKGLLTNVTDTPVTAQHCNRLHDNDESSFHLETDEEQNAALQIQGHGDERQGATRNQKRD